MVENIKFKYNIQNISDKQLKESNLVVHTITKSEVDKKDYSNTEYLFGRLISLKKDSRGKIVILFSGYDDIPDEIYTIKEIRDYVMDLFLKYPYMFYFLNQRVDSSFKSIFLCLCEVTAYSPMNANTIKEVVFDKKNISTVSTSYSISNNIMKIFIEKTMEYGKKVGEKNQSIMEIIDNLLKNNSSNDLKKINELNTLGEITLDNLIELYTKSAYALWESLTSSNKIQFIPEFMAIEFLKQNIFILNVIRDSPLIMNYMISENKKITNMFVVRDYSHGVICDTCNTSQIVLYKSNIKPQNLSDCILLPSLENYISMKILPIDQEFLKQHPIPIDYRNDKWICPNCMKMHNFKYLKDLGLMY